MTKKPAKAKLPKRHVYTLTLPVKGADGEMYRLLKVGGAAVGAYHVAEWDKRGAEQETAYVLTAFAERFCQHSELQVQRKDGTFAVKNTYGGVDPKPKVGQKRNRG